MQLTKQTKLIISVALVLSIALITFTLFQKQEVESPPQTVQEKKAAFRALIVPAVDHVYADLMQQYEEVKKETEAGQSNDDIEELKEKYKVTTDADLLMALKPSPRSITIAQAAMESAWATSRFFKKANNVFGVWSFNDDEPRIAALKKRDGKTIWLKKYRSVEKAVADYYFTLATSNAFSEFRKTKMVSNDPFVLVTKLDHYSEKGSAYGKELTSIIKANKFDEYDKN